MGFILTFFYLEKRKINNYMAIIMLLFSLYLFGYSKPTSWYNIFNISFLSNQTILYTISSCLLLTIFASNNFISNKFFGKMSHFLGFISFPLYIMHIPIMASVSSIVYIFYGGNNLAVIMAAIILMITLFPVLIILGRFDIYWVKILSNIRPSRYYIK